MRLVRKSRTEGIKYINIIIVVMSHLIKKFFFEGRGKWGEGRLIRRDSKRIKKKSIE